WGVDNLFCSTRELIPRDKMAPLRWSRARHNISEIFCLGALRPLRAGSESMRRAMRLNRRVNVERKKTFPVFSPKNPEDNWEFVLVFVFRAGGQLGKFRAVKAVPS